MRLRLGHLHVAQPGNVMYGFLGSRVLSFRMPNTSCQQSVFAEHAGRVHMLQPVAVCFLAVQNLQTHRVGSAHPTSRACCSMRVKVRGSLSDLNSDAPAFSRGDAADACYMPQHDSFHRNRMPWLSGLDGPLGYTPERALHLTPGRRRLYLIAFRRGIFASALSISAKIPHLDFRADVKRFGPKPSDLQRHSAAAPALSADEACVVSRGLAGFDLDSKWRRRSYPCCGCARPCEEAGQDRENAPGFNLSSAPAFPVASEGLSGLCISRQDGGDST